MDPHTLDDRLDDRAQPDHGGPMSDRLQLRRHLYEDLAFTRRGAGRRALHRQISQLAAAGRSGPDDGPAGVREPRRPSAPQGPASRALEP